MASPFLSGYLYYVQFIDDFSRKSWIYFLKAKSETINKYEELKSLVENHIGNNICPLRYDNGC